MAGGPPPPPPRPPFCDETTQAIRGPRPGSDDGENEEHMPHTAPVIASATRIKVELGTLAKWAAAIISVTVWALLLWSDVQRLKEDTREMRTEYKQIAADVATIKRVVIPAAYASTAHDVPRLVIPQQDNPNNE